MDLNGMQVDEKNKRSWMKIGMIIKKTKTNNRRKERGHKQTASYIEDSS